jgi:hypothetical protein
VKAAPLTQARVKEVLHYEPSTGLFTWLVSLSFSSEVGNVAGGIDDRGYRRICVDQQRHRAHRLAWLYTYGYLPRLDVDHINGVLDDNRVSNLRLATKSQNIANSQLRSDNTSGRKGVVRRGKKWGAQIICNGKRHYLGSYETVDEAHAAYVTAAKRLQGQFARAA